MVILTEKVIISHKHSVNDGTFHEDYTFTKDSNTKSFHYELKYDINADDIMHKGRLSVRRN